MRTTIDIADDQYALLKSRAAEERTSVKALIAFAVAQMLTRKAEPEPHKTAKLPTIGSKSAKKLNLNHDRVNDLLADIA